MSDPFIVQLPKKLADDPELSAYFNFLNKVLHDLTTKDVPELQADVEELQNP